MLNISPHGLAQSGTPRFGQGLTKFLEDFAVLPRWGAPGLLATNGLSY